MKDVLEKILNELKNDKIAPEAEYNALRGEKIFRYGYANSVNTTLLTLTLAVFSVGGLLFTSSNEDFTGIAEIFFPLFFLIPCLFARIGFKSLVKNSVRIGLLSEYMREHLFKNENAWECIKGDDKLNYFMEPKKYIGGVKEVPQCVSVVSILFSAIIGYHPIYMLISDQLKAISFLLICLCGIGLIFFLRQNFKWADRCILVAVSCFTAGVIIYYLCDTSPSESCVFLLKLILYFLPSIVAILLVPNFKNEISEANNKLEDYKKEISKKNSTEVIS